MRALVTIMTFPVIADLAIVRGRLEADGIECFTKNEYNSQNRQDVLIYGGAQLQVREENALQAIQILKEYGYLHEYPQEATLLEKKIQQQTDRIPMLNKFPLSVRILAILGVILAIVIVASVLFSIS